MVRQDRLTPLRTLPASGQGTPCREPRQPTPAPPAHAESKWLVKKEGWGETLVSEAAASRRTPLAAFRTPRRYLPMPDRLAPVSGPHSGPGERARQGATAGTAKPPPARRRTDQEPGPGGPEVRAAGCKHREREPSRGGIEWARDAKRRPCTRRAADPEAQAQGSGQEPDQPQSRPAPARATRAARVAQIAEGQPAAAELPTDRPSQIASPNGLAIRTKKSG